MARAEKVALAVKWRGEGKSLQKISEALAVSPSTVSSYLADPDLSKLRARKAGYAGVCVDCGRPTDGSNGRSRAPERCSWCVALHQRDEARWPPDAIIERAQEWFRRFGVAPRASQWRSRQMLAGLVDDPECWPLTSTVQDVCLRWNLMLSAANLPVLEPGGYPRGQASVGSSTLRGDGARQEDSDGPEGDPGERSAHGPAGVGVEPAAAADGQRTDH